MEAKRAPVVLSLGAVAAVVAAGVAGVLALGGRLPGLEGWRWPWGEGGYRKTLDEYFRLEKGGGRKRVEKWRFSEMHPAKDTLLGVVVVREEALPLPLPFAGGGEWRFFHVAVGGDGTVDAREVEEREDVLKKRDGAEEFLAEERQAFEAALAGFVPGVEAAAARLEGAAVPGRPEDAGADGESAVLRSRRDGFKMVFDRAMAERAAAERDWRNELAGAMDKYRAWAAGNEGRYYGRGLGFELPEEPPVGEAVARAEASEKEAATARESTKAWLAAMEGRILAAEEREKSKAAVAVRVEAAAGGKEEKPEARPAARPTPAAAREERVWGGNWETAFQQGVEQVRQGDLEGLKRIRGAAERPGGLEAALWLESWHATRDKAESVHWCHRAADLGCVEAMRRMAGHEPQHALSWWKKVYENGGGTEAARAIARCYETGAGCGKNFAEARRWYRRAGDEASAERLRALEKKTSLMGNQ